MQYSGGEIRALLKDSGGSAYIVDFAAFQRNVEQFLAAFRAIYPNTNLGYSYKTNYLPELCIQANRMGLYAEVVSGAEYQVARSYGVAGDRIIFNGPVKSEPELDAALQGGSLVNVDCLEEVSRIRRICDGSPDRMFDVGVRCHISPGDKGHSRFGFPPGDGQLDAAFRQLNAIPNCTVAGLHCHSSSDRGAGSYRERTETMLELADRLFTHSAPRFLDLGGGFFGPMPEALRAQLGHVPGYTCYAGEVAELFAERYGRDGATELILEPGVGILADAMRFACEIVSIKELPRRCVAVTTGSYQNIKPSINRINLPITVLPAAAGRGTTTSRELDLVGYTCIEDDVLFHDYKGPLEVGDIVVFENVGAYSVVFKPPFIRGMPAIVCQDEASGGWRVLYRQQSFAHWLTGPSQTGDMA